MTNVQEGKKFIQILKQSCTVLSEITLKGWKFPSKSKGHFVSRGIINLKEINVSFFWHNRLGGDLVTKVSEILLVSFWSR